MLSLCQLESQGKSDHNFWGVFLSWKHHYTCIQHFITLIGFRNLWLVHQSFIYQPPPSPQHLIQVVLISDSNHCKVFLKYWQTGISGALGSHLASGAPVGLFICMFSNEKNMSYIDARINYKITMISYSSTILYRYRLFAQNIQITTLQFVSLTQHGSS